MKSMRVLLVDDEEELVLTLAERLNSRGIDARAATSGTDALASLRENRFDILVVDLKMPGVSGSEIIKIVEREFPQVRILLVTGHGGSELEEPTEQRSEVLLKPFKIEDLIAKMREMLNLPEGCVM
jgi:DNA-binding NtrC family response regulator